MQPGVPDYVHWTSSWLLQRTCFRCLGPCLSFAAEESYPRCIKQLVDLYPDCWGIIVEGEELMRLERMPQMLRELRNGPEAASFKALPLKVALSQVSNDRWLGMHLRVGNNTLIACMYHDASRAHILSFNMDTCMLQRLCADQDCEY